MISNKKKVHMATAVLGGLLVVWLGLLIAPFATRGLLGIASGFEEAISRPFHIHFCEDSLRTVVVCLGVYALILIVVRSSSYNYRKREEHGSAKWGDAAVLNHKYASPEPSENRILTRNVSMGLDTHKHMRNLNTLVVGGSGAGKTRSYCKPNVLQAANSSLVILDPNGYNLGG